MLLLLFLLFVRCQVYFILFYFLLTVLYLSLLILKNDKSSYANVTGHTTEHGRKQELLNQHKHKRKEGGIIIIIIIIIIVLLLLSFIHISHH